MSLINEALKRAKQVQVRQAPVPAAEPVLEPVVNPAPAPKDLSRLLPIGAGIVLVLACWFLLLWWRSSGPAPTPVDAAAANGVAEVMAAAARLANSVSNRPPGRSDAPVHPASFNSTPSPALSSSVSAPAPVQAAAAPTPPAAVFAAASTDAPRSSEAAVSHAPSASLPVVAAPAEPPSTHKLQAIFYRTTRASAQINGQTVFVGDDIDGATLLSIERQLVRLRVNGRTNVLRLR